MQLDSRAPKSTVQDYLLMENRFKMLTKSKPEQARVLFKLAQGDADARRALYESLATRKLTPAADQKKDETVTVKTA
jgi:pyruvate-ferredoxin/flavodoxin oxidoreductase